MNKKSALLYIIFLLAPCYFHDVGVRTYFETHLSIVTNTVVNNINRELPMENGLDSKFRLVCVSGCRNDLSFLPNHTRFTLRSALFLFFRTEPYQRTYSYNRQTGEIVVC